MNCGNTQRIVAENVPNEKPGNVLYDPNTRPHPHPCTCVNEMSYLPRGWLPARYMYIRPMCANPGTKRARNSKQSRAKDEQPQHGTENGEEATQAAEEAQLQGQAAAGEAKEAYEKATQDVAGEY